MSSPTVVVSNSIKRYSPSLQNGFWRERWDLQNTGLSSHVGKLQRAPENLAQVGKEGQGLNAENLANYQGIIEYYTSTPVLELIHSPAELCKADTVSFKVYRKITIRILITCIGFFLVLREQQSDIPSNGISDATLVFRNSTVLAFECKLTLWQK